MFQPIFGLAGFLASPPPPPPAGAPEGAPTQEELVQNEIDYLNRDAQNEIDYGNELNQTSWSSDGLDGGF